MKVDRSAPHLLWTAVPVLAVALALRSFSLGERNTWYDEVGSILFAEKGLATIIQATAADTMPPLYYFLLHYWLILGNNLWVARSLSVALSLGIVALAFVIARRLFGVRVAFFASLLVSVNPFQVYHGQEVRMYSLLGLSQLLSVYFLLKCLDGRGLKNWVGFVLSQSAAMYTHNAAFLSLLTVDAYVFGFGLLFLLGKKDPGWGRLGKQPSAFLKELLFANAAIVVIFLPWLAFLPGQMAKVARAFWIEPPGVMEVIRSIVVFTFNLPGPASWAFPILLAVSLFLFALLVYSIVAALRCRDGSFPIVFTTTMFVGPVSFAVLVSLVRPIFIERVLITSSVIYLILLAWMGERLRPRFVAPVLFLLVIFLSAWALVSYYQYDGFPRVGFPKVMAYLERNVAPGDVIIHDNKLTFFPGYYLNRSLPQQFLADPKWSVNDTLAEQTQEALGLKATSLEAATRGKSRVWFLIFRQALAEAKEQGRTQENKDWLDRRFKLAGEETFGDLSVYLYTKTFFDERYGLMAERDFGGIGLFIYRAQTPPLGDWSRLLLPTN